MKCIGALPDLVVTDIQAPLNAEGGTEIRVTWTVENLGNGDALPGGWLDRIYLSDDPDPKAEFATTMLLAEVRRDGPLPQGGSYTADHTFTLSPSAEGQYLTVITDDEVEDANFFQLPGFLGQFQEPPEEFFPVLEVFEDNNATTVDTSITPVPANLVVSDFDIPTGLLSGEDFTFSYSVTNIGDRPVWSGTRG